MSKSPAFQWYAADYLADERVMLLSLESEAAYVRLLNYCWREGSIPSNPALCVPMCKYADVKVIKPALALFMKSPTQSGRLIHKRLEEERAKQGAFRAKQVENGKRGGRPRRDEKPSLNPGESQENPSLSGGLILDNPEKALLFSSSTSSSNNTSSLQSEVGVPAESLEVEEQELPTKSPDASAPHTEGAADVPTRKAAKFIPPTGEQVLAYMLAQRPHHPAHAIEQLADKWLAHYQANGWKVGRDAMKDWQAACRKWLADIPKGVAAPELTVYRNPNNSRVPPSQVTQRQAAIAASDARFDALSAGQNPY